MLFSREEHADNGPATWSAVKVADRCWHLVTRSGDVLHYGRTRRECEELTRSGFYVNLYERERRAYARS